MHILTNYKDPHSESNAMKYKKPLCKFRKASYSNSDRNGLGVFFRYPFIYHITALVIQSLLSIWFVSSKILL